MSNSDIDDRIDARLEVLHNEDLLAIVFNQMAPDSDAIDGGVLARTDLLSAAQVCKTFMEPALDKLWQVLPSLIPLLKLLPAFGELDGVYFLEGIRKNDWERYDIHARRVRVLDLKPTRLPVSPFLYPCLTRHRTGPLLPALRELRIPDNSSIDLTPVCILSTPQLEVAELHNNAIADTQFFSVFLTSLETEHPKLRSLVLEGERVVNLKPVLQLTSLQKLELRMPNVHLSTTFMEDLGNIESLVDLTLHAGVTTPNIFPEPIRRDPRPRLAFTFNATKRPPTKFQHLKHLHVLGTLPSIARIMEYMDFRSLTSFALTELSDPSGTRLDSFWLRCFEHHADARCMVSIEVNQLSQRTWGHEGYSLSAAALEPLLELNTLRSFAINNASFKATDADLMRFCSAFPQLKTLKLPSECYTFVPTIFQVVGQLSLQWTELEELQISLGVNVDIQHTLDALTRESVKISRPHNHPLRKLYINFSPNTLSNEQSVQFARFLDYAFPNLEVLESFGLITTVDHWGNISTQPVMNSFGFVRLLQAAFQEGSRRSRQEYTTPSAVYTS